MSALFLVALFVSAVPKAGAKGPVQVFLFAGQSNMVGADTRVASTPRSTSRSR